MRARTWLVLALLLGAGTAAAASADAVLARGARDGKVPAWAIAVATPPGWTRDCCMYARAIGVDAVLYQGDWSGKPQRVMVLNVWPRELPTLAAEVDADHRRYHQLDPAGRIARFALRHPTMRCDATVYQGSDHIDDVLAFCEPAQDSGIRLSWSMTLDADEPQRRALLDAFMQVVMASRYQRDGAAHAH